MWNYFFLPFCPPWYKLEWLQKTWPWVLVTEWSGKHDQKYPLYYRAKHPLSCTGQTVRPRSESFHKLFCYQHIWPGKNSRDELLRQVTVPHKNQGPRGPLVIKGGYNTCIRKQVKRVVFPNSWCTHVYCKGWKREYVFQPLKLTRRDQICFVFWLFFFFFIFCNINLCLNMKKTPEKTMKNTRQANDTINLYFEAPYFRFMIILIFFFFFFFEEQSF